MSAKDGASRLGARTKRIKILDYYTVPWEDVPAGTPNPVMIAIRDWYTGKETAFAWHLVAEREAIPAAEIPERREELERAMLEEFARHLQESRSARWVHWGLNDFRHGFSALQQRMVALGVNPPRVSESRFFDLKEFLKNELGECYVSHPRLPTLVDLNQINRMGWLSLEELSAAYRAGEYQKMLASLFRKMDCISHICDLYRKGELQTERPPQAEGLSPRRDISRGQFFHWFRLAVSSRPPAPAEPGWQDSHEVVGAESGKEPKEEENAGPDGKRMTAEQANAEAMRLARKEGRAFCLLSERKQAERIGCSWATWQKAPLYEVIKKQRVRIASQIVKGKVPASPPVMSLTSKLEATQGTGETDQILKQLIGDQEADYEPSPLDEDPDSRSRKVRTRKRV